MTTPMNPLLNSLLIDMLDTVANLTEPSERLAVLEIAQAFIRATAELEPTGAQTTLVPVPEGKKVLVLMSVPPTTREKIDVIKALRNCTGLGLAEAKKTVESAPLVLLSEENDAMEGVFEALKRAGADLCLKSETQIQTLENLYEVTKYRGFWTV